MLWATSVTCTSQRRCRSIRAITSTARTSQTIAPATITNSRVRSTASADSATAASYATLSPATPAVSTAATSNRRRDGQCTISALSRLGLKPWCWIAAQQSGSFSAFILHLKTFLLGRPRWFSCRSLASEN